MEENKQNKDREENQKNTKFGPATRSSSNGRDSSQGSKPAKVVWDDCTAVRTARGPARSLTSIKCRDSSHCSSTATVVWDSCSSTSSARGDQPMDIVVEPPDTRSGTRKRKCSVQTNVIEEKKPKSKSYIPSLTTSQTFSESSEERGVCLEDRGDLNKEEVTALCHEIPVQDIYVLSATSGSSKPATIDAGCQTTKSPLVPVSPVVSFFEPAPEPERMEISYFGAGARLEDGTLRPPPVFCIPGTCSAKKDSPKKDSPTVENDVHVVKDWMLEKKGKETPQAKKDVEPDPLDKNKKNNTDRYLKMF